MAKQLPAQIMTLVSILTAFVATSLTIVLTAANNEAIERLKNMFAKHFNALIIYHVESIYVGLIGIGMSLFVLVKASMANYKNDDMWFILWLLPVTSSVWLFVRIVHLLQKLLRQKVDLKK